MRYHRFAEYSIADGIEMSGVVCVSAHSNTQFGEIESYTVCMSRALKQWNILNYRKSAHNEERARNVYIVHTVHTQAAILDVLQFIPTTFVFHEQTLKRCMSINPSISAREMMMRFMFYFTTSVRHKFWWFSIWIVHTYLHTLHRLANDFVMWNNRSHIVDCFCCIYFIFDTYAKWAVAAAVALL